VTELRLLVLALAWAALLPPARAHSAPPADVTGTLLAVEPAAADGLHREGRLRVETACGAPGVTPGASLRLRYPLPLAPPLPGPGDLVRACLQQNGDVWETAEALTVLGRGEFRNPGEGAVTDTGSAGAPVLVKILAPFHTDCQARTRDLLVAYAAAHPAQVRLQVFDLAQPPGRAEALRERLQCATVLINNRFAFTLAGASGLRRVCLQHRPDTATSSYRAEDAVAALAQEVQRLTQPRAGASP